MLFRKKIEPRCAYCKRAEKAGAGQMICKKKGICSETGKCHAFQYDPLKRVPPKPHMPDFSKYQDEDFTL